ncbi:MAG: hypothetical protein Q7J73_02240 [Dehalococcoidales bacterium]|nr:hypothetical protein [Dehalococcoidales bacterium]
MYQYLMGVVVGIGAGTAIGFYLGNGRKRWSDLTPEGKKTSTITIASGVVLLTAGIIILLNMVLT